jgi:hypothetical protein
MAAKKSLWSDAVFRWSVGALVTLAVAAILVGFFDGRRARPHHDAGRKRRRVLRLPAQGAHRADDVAGVGCPRRCPTQCEGASIDGQASFLPR